MDQRLSTTKTIARELSGARKTHLSKCDERENSHVIVQRVLATKNTHGTRSLSRFETTGDIKLFLKLLSKRIGSSGYSSKKLQNAGEIVDAKPCSAIFPDRP